jgi:hypothetical protein
MQSGAMSDTTKKIEPVRKTQSKSTVRLHTKGVFLYSGRLSCENPAFDINFIYNRPAWGFQFYKAVDLTDHTTANNFALATFYKNFNLTRKLTFTPYIGTFLEQYHALADHGSDVVVLAVTSYKVSPHFTAEYTTLVGNLVVEPELRDWVNRVRFLFSYKHWDVTGSFWHNNQVFDEVGYASAGLTIAYSRVKLSDNFNLSVSATELGTVASSNEGSSPKINRFLLSASVQFVK